MPLLFAVWANAHGGWIVGIGVLAAWGACVAIAGRVPWAWAAGSVLLALAGSLATPYGTGLWRFLWATVGLGRADITEWQPATADVAFLAAWAAAAALLALAWRLGGRAALPLLAPAIVVGVAAFRVIRLGGFFALTNVLLLAPCFAGRGPARLPLSRPPSARNLLAVGALCLAGLAATAAAVQGRIGCVTLAVPGPDEQWAPEAEAVLFLRDNPIRGRMLTYFDYGELAIWHLAPRVRVSYDGRRDGVLGSRAAGPSALLLEDARRELRAAASGRLRLAAAAPAGRGHAPRARRVGRIFRGSHSGARPQQWGVYSV